MARRQQCCPVCAGGCRGSASRCGRDAGRESQSRHPQKPPSRKLKESRRNRRLRLQPLQPNLPHPRLLRPRRRSLPNRPPRIRKPARRDCRGRRSRKIVSAADRAPDRAQASVDVVDRRLLRRLSRLLLRRQASVQPARHPVQMGGRVGAPGHQEGRADLHGAAGILLHAGQARHVRRAGHRLSDHRRADLQIRGARPLQERAWGFPALPDRLAAPVPAGRRAGLFLLHADGHVVLPVDAAGRRRRDRCRFRCCPRSPNISASS